MLCFLNLITDIKSLSVNAMKCDNALNNFVMLIIYIFLVKVCWFFAIL